MAKLTKLQKAQLAYAVENNGGLLVKAGNWKRAIRESALDRCWKAFNEMGLMIEEKRGRLTHYYLDHTAALDYVKKHNLTTDYLYNREKL
jgi:hypothetical protein